ncbi:CBS domain-containing protein [Saonia flava]|uniref:CBS domain-containing protein n=1 Tax=Saonia flava TaxID=523696 RepID=A0A846QZU9_9FLAO|nr:CBS domain-containing protein [Saonia flava]NJB72202.1 CBS domain-containing protein [Saonia flava]
MGTHQVNKIDRETRAEFVRHLLSDVRALEIMLEKGLIESGINRIGSEQEFCLINENWRPAKNAMAILEAINDPHFTTEMALYNLEINLDPLELKENCFSKAEKQLKDLLRKASLVAKEQETKVLLTGILPTIGKNELQLEYMTPSQRYQLLNETVRQMRKKDLELHIRGVDELSIIHDSILFEACNTSFQMHLQISPEDFVSSHNWAQAISGPVLGICANSPMLLGRELWSETRIALFQQSVDTRSSSYTLKDKEARVSFGNHWASGSIVDIFKDDISRYEVLLGTAIERNSLEELEKGNIPKLKALALNNGTIYRWNRPCYGHGEKKAHVRIENRYIPAGPTVLDEMANFAFWVGLMIGRPSKYDDMPNLMDFKDVKANFIKSARTGSDSIMQWMGRSVPTPELVVKELLPLAYSGLEKASIDKEDIERFLGVIEKRASGMTGAKWNIRNYRQLKKSMKKDDALVVLTKSIYENQQGQLPIHEWPMMTEVSKDVKHAYLAEHIMSTQLFTVNKNDLADMATSIMQWKNIHHVPVENDEGELCGLITWSHMKEHIKVPKEQSDSIVADIMITNVMTTNPDRPIKEIIHLMKEHGIGCLPVVQNNNMIGIITTNDITGI